MATQNIFNMTDTWNSGATTFTALKMNVTDTSSNAASLLIDLQVGGASRFKVEKSGTLTLTNSGATVLMSSNSGTGNFAVFGTITAGSTSLLTTSVALTNGAAAQVATLTNGPTAGNPTKWVPIVDNGTTRYIPAW